MPKKMLIRLSNTSYQSTSCLVMDDNKIDYSYNNKNNLADIPVVVLVPGTDVLILQKQFPKLSAAQLTKAIPYALEDQLSDNIQQLHFAIMNIQEDNTLTIAIASKKKMDEWKTQLSSFLQHTPSDLTLLPEFLFLPNNPENWTLYSADNTLSIKMDSQTGFCIEIKEFWKLLPSFLKDSQKKCPSQITLIGDITVPSPILNLFEELHIAVLQQPQEDLLVIAAKNNDKFSHHLLQGIYKTKKQHQKYILSFYSALTMLLLGVGILIASELLQISMLSYYQSKLDKQITTTFTTIFPNTVMPVNKIKDYAQRELQSLKKSHIDNHFLDLMKTLSPIIAQTEGLKIIELDYSENQLSLLLESKQFSLFDNFTTLLTQKNLKVEQTDAKRFDNHFQSRLLIKDMN